MQREVQTPSIPQSSTMARQLCENQPVLAVGNVFGACCGFPLIQCGQINAAGLLVKSHKKSDKPLVEGSMACHGLEGTAAESNVQRLACHVRCGGSLKVLPLRKLELVLEVHTTKPNTLLQPCLQKAASSSGVAADRLAPALVREDPCTRAWCFDCCV